MATYIYILKSNRGDGGGEEGALQAKVFTTEFWRCEEGFILSIISCYGSQSGMDAWQAPKQNLTLFIRERLFYNYTTAWSLRTGSISTSLAWNTGVFVFFIFLLYRVVITTP